MAANTEFDQSTAPIRPEKTLASAFVVRCIYASLALRAAGVALPPTVREAAAR
jgi:hypothetical protein